jgi:hypothetical protein
VDITSIEAEPSPPSSDDESNTTFKLAYTSNNGPIHMYNEELSRLLVSLDAIESWGSKSVREQRREGVRRIEMEARRVETLYEGIWKNSRNATVQAVEEAPIPQVDADVSVDNTETLQASGDQVVREDVQQMEDVEDTTTVDVGADASKEEMRLEDEVEDTKGETETIPSTDADIPKEDTGRMEEVDSDTSKEEPAKIEVDPATVDEVKGEDDAEMAEVEITLATGAEAPKVEDDLLTSEL